MRRGSAAIHEYSARQAAIRAIGRGEPPVYRGYGLRTVTGMSSATPGSRIDAKDRHSATEATRAAIAEWLDVEPDAFEWRRTV